MPVNVEEIDVVPRPEQGPAPAAPTAPAPSPVPQSNDLARVIALLHSREDRLRAC